MIVSVIIPSYNMAGHALRSVQCLIEQNLPPGVQLELQVVDDGSSDDTEDVLRRITSPLLHYQQRPRDELSCRSRARNLGLEASRGDVAVFLDAGVLVNPEFVSAVAAHFERQQNLVVLHPTLGLFAEREDPELSNVERAHPGELRPLMDRLRPLPGWRDPRQGLFDLGVHRLTAPWLLGWSCALSVSARLAKQVGGFDEEFIGWGGEDLDFSSRLERAGAKFEAARETVLHLPHERVLDPRCTQARNLRKLWGKHRSIAAELVCVLPSRQAAILHPRLERIVPAYVLPEYGQADGMVWARARLAGAARTAFAFPADAELGRSAGANVVLSCASFASNPAHSSCEELRTLGCVTDFPDHYFDVLVCSDALRLFDPRVSVAQMREFKRIARSVFVLFTPDEAKLTHGRSRQREFRSVDGWGWASREELEQLALSAGYQWQKQAECTKVEVYEIC